MSGIGASWIEQGSAWQRNDRTKIVPKDDLPFAPDYRRKLTAPPSRRLAVIEVSRRHACAAVLIINLAIRN